MTQLSRMKTTKYFQQIIGKALIFVMLTVCVTSQQITTSLYGQSSSAGNIKSEGPPEISGGAMAAGKRIRVTGELKKGSNLPAIPPSPTPNAPPLSFTIEGFNFDDNITETEGFFFIPPDPIGAAGPDHVVAVVNVMIEWHTKAGVLQFRDALSDFFAPLSPTTLTFDPKVIYDQHADRFVVVTLERIEGGANPSQDNVSRILLAVTDDADPNGRWHFHAIDAKTVIDDLEYWADYPGFAVDEEAVYITNNMFRFFSIPFGGVRLWIVDKGLGTGGFYDGGTASVTVHDPYEPFPSSFPATTQPAHVFGAGPGAGVGTFLVSYSGLTENGSDEFVQSIQVNNPVTSPSFSNHQFINVGDIENSFGSPFPDAPQLGSAVAIETNDRRALHAVWRANALWMTAEILSNEGDPDSGQVTAHWWNLNTSTLSTLIVSDQGDVGGEDIAPGTFTFFPSIAVNSAGDMTIGFAASAPTIFPGAFYTGRLASDPPGMVQPTGVLRVGLDSYARTDGVERNRWGDYSGMSVDPLDDMTFWVFNEYALEQGIVGSNGEDGRWGTAFGRCDFTPISGIQIIVTPTDINFGTVGVGNSSTVLVAISNGGTMPLTLEGISGSGAPFSVSGPPTFPSVVPTFGSEFLNVTFSPTSTGIATGIITISSNDAEHPTVDVTLSGQGETGILVDLPDDAVGDSGTSVTIPIEVGDLTGKNVISYQATITFDESVLDAIGASSTGTLSESFGPPTVNVSLDGQITLGGFDTSPLSGSGILVNLNLNVVGQPGEMTDLVFESFIFNSGDPPADTLNGKFTVSVDRMLITNVNPESSGTITRNPDKETFSNGESVELTATANAGFEFVSWSGDIGDVNPTDNPITVVMNQNRSVVANFAPIHWTLMTNINLESSGTIIRNPDKETYDDGESVELTAVPADGFGFNNWTGDIGDATPTDNPITIVMNQNRNVTANFNELVPDIAVEPTSHNYGVVEVGSSASQTFIVSNAGTAELVVDAESTTEIIGENADQFSIDRGEAPFTVSPGENHEVVISFDPTSEGEKSAAFRITSNDPDPEENPLDLALMGFGLVVPEATLKADYQFQNTLESSVAGAPVLTNLGSNTFQTATVDGIERTALRFAANDGLSLFPTTDLFTFSIGSGVILFAFDEVSDYRRIVDFKNGASDTGLYNFNGNLSFFDLASGSGAPIVASTFVHVVLTRDINQTVVGYVDGVQQFSFVDTDDQAVIDANNTLRFFRDDVAVPDEASAGFVARIRVYDGALTADEVAALDRLPIVADIAVEPTSHDYGDVEIGSSASQTFVVSNEGTTDLIVDADSTTEIIGENADQFLIESGGAPFTVLPGETHEVVVSFNPTSEGEKSAIFRIASNDPDMEENPFDIPLMGNGVTLGISITPPSVQFGGVPVGNSSDQMIALTNHGSADLTINSTDITGDNAGDFEIISGGGTATIEPSASLEITFRFSPQSEGSKTAFLVITSTAPSSPDTVELYGIGGVNPLAETPWPMVRHDLQHTGRSPFNGPEQPALEWSFTTGDGVMSSPSIGLDGTIYVGSGDKDLLDGDQQIDNKIYAIRPDGSLKWSFTTGEDVISSPAIASDGTIYVGSVDRKLYAINPDGSLKWSFVTGDAVFSSPAIGEDGTIYVGSGDPEDEFTGDDTNLYAINSDGTLKWAFATNERVLSSPAVGADGTIYVGSFDSNLYAINPDGTLKWSFTAGETVSSSPALGSDGTIYIASDDNNVYAINPDGTLKWSFPTSDAVFSSPAIGEDGTIYIGSGDAELGEGVEEDTKLYALNPDGTLKWSFPTGNGVLSSPALDSNGTIFVGSFDNKLYAINPDGTLQWSFATDGAVFSSPAIGSDGTVYVGSIDNNLYAITLAQPIPVSLPDTTGDTNTSVTIPVEVGDLTDRNIISYQTVITFDESVLDATGASSEGTLSEPFGEPTVNTLVDGRISIVGFGTSPLSGSGTLVNLSLDVIGQPGEMTDLVFAEFIFNAGNPPSITVNGKFTTIGFQVDPDSTTVTADPTNIPANGVSVSTITVIPKNSQGNDLGPGQTVSLTSTAGALLGSIMDVGNGTYTQQLQSSISPTTAIVTATVNGVVVNQKPTVSFTPLPADPDSTTVTADPTSIPADGSSMSTIMVIPRNSLGNNLGSGHNVTLTTDAGNLLDTVMDVGDGTYTQQLQSSTMPATATVTAMVDGVVINQKPTIVFARLPADPDSTTVTADPARIANDGVSVSTIIVIPIDSLGNEVGDGQTVGLSTTLGTLLDQVVDNGDGTYTQDLQSSRDEGVATITAVVDGQTMNQTAQVEFTSSLCVHDGDVNESSDITPEDARLAFTIFLQETDPVGCEAIAADRNCSGSVTPKDASDIFKEYLGDPIPACSGDFSTAVSSASSGAFNQNTPVGQVVENGEDATIEIKDVFAKQGEEISIPVLIEKFSELVSFGFDLIFPTDLLIFTSVSKSELTRDFVLVEGKELKSGLLRVGGFGIESIASVGSDPLVYLNFKVNEDAVGGGEFVFLSMADELVGANTTGGTVEIVEGDKERLSGDVTGDGTIDITDLIRAINIVLDIGPPPTESEFVASDSNGDGDIDIEDIIYIINKILGV